MVCYWVVVDVWGGSPPALGWVWLSPFLHRCDFCAAGAGHVRASMRKRPATSTKALMANRRASAGRLAKNSPNVSNAHLHVDMSDCLPPSWTWAPFLHRDMSQNAPLSVPY